MYNIIFSHEKKKLSDQEERVARTRAQFARRGRQQARCFAEADKRPRLTKGTSKVDEALPLPKGKKLVPVMKVDGPCVTPSLGERHARAVPRNTRPPVVHDKAMAAAPSAPGVGEEVQRTIYTPARFLSHLKRQDQFFLQKVGTQCGVSITVGTPRTKLHLQGPKGNVQACYARVKVLLVRWHQRQAGGQ